MEHSFEQLVDALLINSHPLDILWKITRHIAQQTLETSSSFVSESIQSLDALEHWAWQQLSEECDRWIDQAAYLTFFHTFASFNRNLIFSYDEIKDETKAFLLIPDSTQLIGGIFKRIDQSNDEQDPFIGIVSVWFDNLSFFLDKNPEFDAAPTIVHINQYMGQNYLMSEQFKFYLIKLQQTQIPQSIFSIRQLFYLKTCTFSASSYLFARTQDFPFTCEEMFQHIGTEYIEIMNIYSRSMETWSKELLLCITHLTGLISACRSRGRDNITQTKTLLPTEQIACNFVQALNRIISYTPFYSKIKAEESNNETYLIDTIMRFLVDILHTESINWFFRSLTSLPETLLTVVNNCSHERICLFAYAILGEISTDEQLRELHITENIHRFFYTMLERGWHHPLKIYKQLPVLHLLRGFVSISKNDDIQQKIASTNKLSIFLEMCDIYPVTFDIIWALSFNQDIQQQLRSNTLFMSKLAYLANDCDNAQMRKITHGILWNLESNHADHSTADTTDTTTFDIMISYSHKDNLLCKQIYDELIRSGYRVWIDFDQMHGNVMDAMAQAIERSHTTIICMSEQYRRSNYCRAEAHYAFQRQRKIVPVLLQKHYKPDGWLLFLVGQLLYVDFTKYEFLRAMEMLDKELKATNIGETHPNPVQSKEEPIFTSLALSQVPPKLVLSPILPRDMADWRRTHVQQWLVGHHLVQMSRLLADCNGRSLLYFDEMIRSNDTGKIVHLLQEDSLRITRQNLSLTELSCFRSLMDEQRRLMEPRGTVQRNSTIAYSSKKHSILCCRMM